MFNVIDILKSIKNPREKKKAPSVGVLWGTDGFLVDSGNNWSLTVELWQAEMTDRSVNRWDISIKRLIDSLIDEWRTD